MKKIISTLFASIILFIVPTYIFAGSTCNNAIDVNINTNINASVIYSSNWQGDPRRYRYYTFVAPSDGSISIVTSNASTDNWVELDNVNCATVPGSGAWGQNITLPTQSVTAGTRYKIYIDAAATSTQTLTLRINFTPSASSGCDDSLDTYANSNSPYAVIPQMDGITSSTSTCISGSTSWSEGWPEMRDRYHFTVAADGVLSVDASSLNNNDYYLLIGDGRSITQHYGVVYANTHNTSINLSAGETVHFYIQAGSYDNHLYQMNLIYTVDSITPPVANAGPNQSAVSGSVITLDGSGSADSDGTIINYVWTENGNILGTGVNTTFGLTGVGVHTILLTVTDDDNLTSTDTVLITLSAEPLDAINDLFGTTEDNNITRNFILNDKGQNVTFTSIITAPSNGTVTDITSNGMFTYTPNAGYIGTDTFVYEVTDDSGATDTAIVSINVNSAINQQGREFTLRYQNSLAGNIETIGNTVLVAPTSENSSTTADNDASCSNYTRGSYISNATALNSDYHLCSYYADTSTSAFPTTSAKLTLPTPESKVVWAGLYWQALVSNGDSRSPANSTSMEIKIRHQDDSTYTTIGYDQLDWDHNYFNNNTFTHDTYSAFKDITYLFKANPSWNKTGDIYVGDIPIFEGQYTGLGTYGAWSLVVIYDDKSQSIKNFSVYDGWVRVGDNSGDFGSTDSIDIEISGFKTPKSVSTEKPIKSTVSVFVAEGDKNINQDFLLIKPSLQSTTTTLSHSSDNQTFDSRIQTPNTFDRSPDPVNNQGIDIQAFDVGTNGENIIKPNESSVTLTLNDTKYANPNGSGGAFMDYYWASMVSFSSDLHVPSLCYDYVVQKNSYTYDINADRNITTYGEGNLSISVAIRSEEGDFDLENTHIKLNLDVSGTATFASAAYSPNTVNTLIPAVFYKGDTSIPDIAIGEHAGINGGTISRLQRYFTQFTYNQTSNVLDGHFDFDINTTIDFGSGPVNYKYSTDASEGGLPIGQCSGFVAYAPVWGQFNIERSNSASFTADNEKFPLYTQIVGRDFNFAIVAYDANSSFTEPLAIDKKITVDVELIDVKPYNDNDFKCSATDTNIIQNLPGNRKSMFVSFPGTGSSRVNVTEDTDLITNKALENAAFRMWLLVDRNNSIIDHNCLQPTAGNQHDGCYTENVGKHIHDPKNVCDSTTCADYVSKDKTRKGCYACYRDYSAIAICSRDNFSIRPETYRLAIVDDNSSNGSSQIELLQNVNTTPTSLAAGYTYKFEGNATRFDSEAVALQYEKEHDLNVTFNDSLSCADQNDSIIGYTFNNGQIIASNNTNKPDFSHNNVGDYLARMTDKEWTRVDQVGGVVDESGLDLKPFKGVDDCDKDNGDTSIDGNTLSGCDIMSNFDDNHTDIALTFEPYQFNITNVSLSTVPNQNARYMLMNDFSDNYYETNDINMSVRFIGSIIAEGQDGTRLSNYTKTCHAIDKNITLILQRTTSPIGEENLTSIDEKLNSYKDIEFQQKLTMQNVPSVIVEGIGEDTSLSGQEFEDADLTTKPGKTLIQLDTTFKKSASKNRSVNPFDVRYRSLIAISGDSNSSTDLATHTPSGQSDYNQTLIYMSAKVTPLKQKYDPTTESHMNTPVYIDIYCRNDMNSSMCQERYDLNSTSYGEDETSDWYSAEKHFTFSDFGLFDVSAATIYGSSPAKVTYDGSTFTGTGSKDDIPFEDMPNTTAQPYLWVSLTGQDRPVTVSTTLVPVPYLKYSISNADGNPQWINVFIGDSVWSGVGNTGQAVGTTSSKIPNTRMNW